MAVLLETGHEFIAGIGGQQFPRELHMARAKLVETLVERRILSFRHADQIEQCVGDPAACGQHDGLAARRILLDDRGDAPHAYGIGDARAAELVDFPGFQTPDPLNGRARRHGGRRATNRTAN